MVMVLNEPSATGRLAESRTPRYSLHEGNLLTVKLGTDGAVWRGQGFPMLGKEVQCSHLLGGGVRGQGNHSNYQKKMTYEMVLFCFVFLFVHQDHFDCN